MQLIAIASSSDGAGKTTLALQLLAKSSNPNGYVVAFAEPLKREVWRLVTENIGEYPLPIGDAFTKPTPAWLRALFRGWGDFRRSLDSEYWVEQWHQRISQLPEDSLVIVDDLRYRNELEAVHDRGGLVLFLDDTSVSDSDVLHELLDVRQMADIGFMINSRVGNWVNVDHVIQTLEIE